MTQRGLIDVIDAVRELLEPMPGSPTWENDEATATSGLRVNRTCEPPIDWMPGVAHFFPDGPDERVEVATVEEEQRFTIVAAYAVDQQGEIESGRRKREVSVALDTLAKRWAETVAQNRTRTVGAVVVWEDLRSVIDWRYMRGLDVRGVAVRLFGYRLVE